MPELKSTSGFQYIQKTQHKRSEIRNIKLPEIAQELHIKKYPSAKQIDLPYSWNLHESRIVPLIAKRRSLRKYAEKSLPLEELSFLLWASQGITAKAGNKGFRTTPSAGALYPIETYLSVHRVDELQPGLYHFDVNNFSLSVLTEISVGDQVAQACLDQGFVATSTVTFLWTAIYRRSMCKYGDRGLRYILLDAGHICQNVLTAAEALGCGGCPIAAFFDDELNAILDVDDGEETVLYAASIGKKGSPV